MGRAAQRENETNIGNATSEQLNAAREALASQQATLSAQKQQYREFEFTNPFSDMENPFEDLTVSQEAARFQMEQGTQQRANIMDRMSGAAGSSGIAGLAQSLANQGTFQARQVSADIAQQEAGNQQLAAKGGARIQEMERQGAAAVQQAEFGRESTMYAAELAELAGTRGAMQGAYGNQMAGLGAISQMNAARMGMYGDIISGVVQGAGNALAPM